MEDDLNVYSLPLGRRCLQQQKQSPQIPKRIKIFYGINTVNTMSGVNKRTCPSGICIVLVTWMKSSAVCLSLTSASILSG